LAEIYRALWEYNLTRIQSTLNKTLNNRSLSQYFQNRLPMREPELFSLMQALSVQYVTDILPLFLVLSGFPTSETSA
jgi:hypothetical protein